MSAVVQTDADGLPWIRYGWEQFHRGQGYFVGDRERGCPLGKIDCRRGIRVNLNSVSGADAVLNFAI
jgi:hypothetical protein